MDIPLITISIPTFNSSKTIKKCLSAVLAQTYKNIEVNIVDRNSSDKTLDIVKEFGIKKIANYEGSLLGARYKGLKMAKGKYILLLDSDQIMKRDTVFRAVKKITNEKLDMVALEERAYSTKKFIEVLLDLDKKLVHKVGDLSPSTGVILARFYKTRLLKDGFKNVPKDLLLSLGGQDHAIIYYEAYSVGNKVKILSKALKHIEPDSLVKIIKKSFRWGFTSVDGHFGKYNKLIKCKERVRKGLFSRGMFVESMASIGVMGIKWVPYKFGFYLGALSRQYKKRRRGRHA